MRRGCALLLLALASCRGPESPSAPPELRLGGALAKGSLAFPDGRKITLEVASDEQSRARGLMFRTSLEPDYGMLFVFPEEGPLEFWMKNTFVDLDMVFIAGDKRVAAIHSDVPRSRPDTPDAAVARRAGRGRYVLELAAGEARRRGLKVGDTLEFPW